MILPVPGAFGYRSSGSSVGPDMGWGTRSSLSASPSPPPSTPPPPTLPLEAPPRLDLAAFAADVAALWADRILLLYQGKLVAEGTPQEVIQQPIISRWYGAEVSMGEHPDAAVPQVYLAP